MKLLLLCIIMQFRLMSVCYSNFSICVSLPARMTRRDNCSERQLDFDTWRTQNSYSPVKQNLDHEGVYWSCHRHTSLFASMQCMAFVENLYSRKGLFHSSQHPPFNSSTTVKRNIFPFVPYLSWSSCRLGWDMKCDEEVSSDRWCCRFVVESCRRRNGLAVYTVMIDYYVGSSLSPHALLTTN
jgi:hypothetical protein